MSVGVVSDPVFLLHQEPPGHPERAQRLTAIGRRLGESGLAGRLTPVPPPGAARESLEAVHDPAYLDLLEKAAGHAGHLDGDTYYSPQSVEAARRAAGGAEALTLAVIGGELESGFALLRPPGHHAERGRAMGFCLINNVAVAAAAARRAGLGRVAIFDWDVHHGNGTQHTFERDPSVLYLSTHQYPFYPGTGRAGETGLGDGEGFTVNLPMPAGCGDAEYLDAVGTVVLPVLEQFRPELILVSAGFDISERDPLGGMRVTGAGFAGLAARLRAAAGRLCRGRIVYLLEGGYDLEGLSGGVEACMADLLDKPAAVPGAAPAHPPWAGAKEQITAVQGKYWKLF